MILAFNIKNYTTTTSDFLAQVRSVRSLLMFSMRIVDMGVMAIIYED